jgi:hypothetical protein
MHQKGAPKTPGSGRKKGTPNKRTLEGPKAEEIAERLGCNPFEVLIHFAKGDWKSLGYEAGKRIVGCTQDGSPIEVDVISPETRLNAAKEASQYLFPKRKALELSTDEEKGFKIILEDYMSKTK